MSLVLADSSVWIELLRRGRSSVADDLRGLLKNKLICTHGVVRAELLTGAVSDEDFKGMEIGLLALPHLEDPPEVWAKVSWARYRLARKGHRATMSDLLLAVAASHHRRPLFTLDAAFERIRTVLPFELYKPLRH